MLAAAAFVKPRGASLLRAPVFSAVPVRPAAAAAPSVRALATAAHKPATGAAPVVDTLGTYDHNFEQTVPDDGHRREFAYLVLGGARFMYASAVRLTVLKFVSTMSASADVLAMAQLEVELDKVPMGTTTTVKWRGKPVFVRHRTEKEIEKEEAVVASTLRDPQTDAERVKDPKWLIALGVCTHLGCVVRRPLMRLRLTCVFLGGSPFPTPASIRFAFARRPRCAPSTIRALTRAGLLLPVPRLAL